MVFELRLGMGASRNWGHLTGDPHTKDLNILGSILGETSLHLSGKPSRDYSIHVENTIINSSGG